MNESAALVSSGKKEATASWLCEYEGDGKGAPVQGEPSVVTDWAGSPLCVIETTKVEVQAFEDVKRGFRRGSKVKAMARCDIGGPSTSVGDVRDLHACAASPLTGLQASSTTRHPLPACLSLGREPSARPPGGRLRAIPGSLSHDLIAAVGARTAQAQTRVNRAYPRAAGAETPRRVGFEHPL